jgi:hypothetical protein
MRESHRIVWHRRMGQSRIARRRCDARLPPVEMSALERWRRHGRPVGRCPPTSVPVEVRVPGAAAEVIYEEPSHVRIIGNYFFKHAVQFLLLYAAYAEVIQVTGGIGLRTTRPERYRRPPKCP